MSTPEERHQRDERLWHDALMGTGALASVGPVWREVMAKIPSAPRCVICAVPFKGPAGAVLRRMGFRPFAKNPRYCEGCFSGVIKKKVGSEVEMTALFADVRGSTPMGERLGPTGFHAAMDRFYGVGVDILLRGGAIVDRFMGDQVVGYFVPGFAGKQHARRAIETGLELLHATGHGGGSEPWIPVGAGVHTGTAFVGTVGRTDELLELTALGEDVTVAARLASVAATGELLCTDAAYRAAALDLPSESRALTLKGVGAEVPAHVLLA